MSDSEEYEEYENSQNTENIDDSQTTLKKKIQIEKPKRKINISDEERERRIERLKNARQKKQENQQEEKSKMDNYLKKKEAEIYNNVMMKLNIKEKKT